MPGVCRLFWTLTCLFLFAAALWADDSSSTTTATAPATPPKAKTEVVEDTLHGHKIADPYRWLENSKGADTQEYVQEELAYTRSILDPLPGRVQTHQRLSQLLSIGTIGTPQLAGKYYLYTRREGTQNQPVLFVREEIHGKDRTLVDVNQLAADGTVVLALQWDYAAWTPRAASFTDQIQGLAQQSGNKGVLVALSGQASPRLQQELKNRSFTIQDRVSPGPLQ